MSTPYDQEQTEVFSNPTHVSPAEARQAADPTVGDGTPDTAPDVAHEDGDWAAATGWDRLKKVRWVPTNKWVVARVVAVQGWLVAFIEAGGDLGDNTTLQILGVTLIAESLTSYLTPNTEPDDGTPSAEDPDDFSEYE